MKLDYRVRDGLTAMQASTRYETFAEECTHLAEQAETERPRRVLAEMAEARGGNAVGLPPVLRLDGSSRVAPGA